MSNFGDFSEQHRDILIQFLVFLLAFVCKLGLQASFLIGASLDWSDYTYYIMQISSYILVDCMPITYMLYSHHKTYRISPEASTSGLQSQESLVHGETRSPMHSGSEEAVVLLQTADHDGDDALRDSNLPTNSSESVKFGARLVMASSSAETNRAQQEHSQGKLDNH